MKSITSPIVRQLLETGKVSVSQNFIRNSSVAAAAVQKQSITEDIKYEIFPILITDGIMAESIGPPKSLINIILIFLIDL